MGLPDDLDAECRDWYETWGSSEVHKSGGSMLFHDNALQIPG